MFTSFVFSFLLFLFSCSCIIEKCHAMSEEASSRLSIRIVIIPSLCVCCLSRAARLRGEKKMAVLSGAREREEQQRRLERKKNVSSPSSSTGSFVWKRRRNAKASSRETGGPWRMKNPEERPRSFHSFTLYSHPVEGQRHHAPIHSHTQSYTSTVSYVCLYVHTDVFCPILPSASVREREREREMTRRLFLFSSSFHTPPVSPRPSFLHQTAGISQ